GALPQAPGSAVACRPLASANLSYSALLLKRRRIPRRYFERANCAPAVRPQLLFASTSVRLIMSDIHNAAVVLMTLPEDQASDLMSKLDPKMMEQVSLEIARTRTIASDEKEDRKRTRLNSSHT